MEEVRVENRREDFKTTRETGNTKDSYSHNTTEAERWNVRKRSWRGIEKTSGWRFCREIE